MAEIAACLGDEDLQVRFAAAACLGALGTRPSRSCVRTWKPNGRRSACRGAQRADAQSTIRPRRCRRPSQRRLDDPALLVRLTAAATAP